MKGCLYYTDFNQSYVERKGEEQKLKVKYDTKLKPLTPELFDTLIASPRAHELVERARAGAHADESKHLLPMIYFQGVLDAAAYEVYVAECEMKGVKPKGSRNRAFMRPTQLLMIDLDHVEGNVEELAHAVVHRMQEQGLLNHLLLVHKTPRGEGLRIIVQRGEAQMALPFEEAKAQWLRLMGVDQASDAACSDHSRGSFLPIKEDIYYIDREALFAPKLLDTTLRQGGKKVAQNAQTMAKPAVKVAEIRKGQPAKERKYPDCYGAVPYALIVERLIPKVEGFPYEGGRHTLIKNLAVELRKITDNNPEWLAEIIPTFGVDEEEYAELLRAMCNYPEPPFLGAKLNSAIKGVSEEMGPIWPLPAMPERLPAVMDLLLSATPERMKAAVAMAVFPSLGVHLTDVRFKYADNKSYEPAFLNLLIAPQASGKSAVDAPIDYILADIRERDKQNRKCENEWREKVKTMGSNKEKPRRPEGLVIQHLAPNTTNAALVKRLKEAGERSLYVKINELEQLRGLADASAKKGAENELIKLAYDRTLYGQERVGVDAVNEQVVLRLNWNASTTQTMAHNFFNANALIDGTLSRITCCTIAVDEDDWGEEIPVFTPYDSEFGHQLKPYIQALEQAEGVYECPQLIEWTRTAQRRFIQYARELNNKVMADYAKRSVRSGFNRAMLLYIMNNAEWTQQIEDFATWSVEYDLWVKWHVFRDRLQKAHELAYGTNGNANGLGVLPKLPQEFTTDMLQEVRPTASAESNQALVRQWKKRGRIVETEHAGVYRKVVHPLALKTA